MIKLLAAFFAFGATMCALTIVLLLFPGTPLDSLWSLNPDAHLAFQSLGNWSVALMVTVGVGCAFAAIGIVARYALGHTTGAGNSIAQHHW
jgi:hypothetical protein